MGIERFSELINIGRRITDYKIESTEEAKEDAANAAAIDEDLGVNLVFEAEEETTEQDLDHVKEESDDEEGADARQDLLIETKVDDSAMEVEELKKKSDLDARSIDAFWLQRKLSDFYKDAHTSQRISDDVFAALSDLAVDDRNTENKLVLLLDYDKFDLIRLLLRNRHKVVYCTKLARARNEKEKKDIHNEMLGNANLRPILEEITRTTSISERSIDLERKLMTEARSLAKQKADDDMAARDADPFWAKRAKAVLDLDALSFERGAHFMANKECKLPKKSEVINKKGYQEVHIPPLKAKPLEAGEKLVAVADMPDWCRPAFQKMNSLNRVQSKVYETALLSAENMLLCAPTGAGKTNVAVLTILREIGLHRLEDGSIDKDAFKVVYVAPMKALVQEMVQNLGQRLLSLGITVKELTGDQQLTKAQIQDTQVIVTTPEKWDIITRKSGDRTYTQLVKLVIIDEIHLLHDSRGPVLEGIIARTIRQIESTQEMIRLVGLSATLPNYEDVAMLLRVKLDKGLFFFDNSYRPCPLQQQFIGITHKKAFKRMELMNQIAYEKVMDHAGKDQVLVFVHTRKETAATAKALRDMAVENDDIGKFVPEDSGRREVLLTEVDQAKNADLKDLLPFGFAIHHAGMSRADRTLVEELFADKHIQVLVSTSTLAWGVNLPAHAVIIKGTQVYNPEKGHWVELSPLDVMQMLGRAGRPQYDEYGEGVVITTHKELHFYLSLLNEQLPVESQLMSRLPDMLNAEIVLGSVTNVKEAVLWLGYTYLYVRMLRAPLQYGVPLSDLDSDPLLEQRRIDLVHTAASILDKHSLVKYDRKTGNFQLTDLGRVASHYYISYQSMAVFNEYLKPTMSDIELFRVFSLSSEFKYMTVRQEEKLELAQLLDKVPIPVKESMEEPSAKVNVLLQAYISRLKLDGFALISDMVFITQSAGRIMRAIFEIVLKRGWAAVTEKTLALCLMIHHRMWGAQNPLRQFRGIPADILKRLEGKDFPWDRLYDLEDHALGELIRFPKMGTVLHKAIHQLPRLELQGHVQPLTRTLLRMELTISPDFSFDEKVHGHAEPFWIWVEDVDGETILHHEYWLLKRQYAGEEHLLSFTIPIQDPLPPQYYVRVLSDRWLGSQAVLPISFRHLMLPEKYPPPTELLDLQPLPITELGHEKYIAFYSGQFDVFNPIQTQVFSTLYKGDTNVLLAAPTGSGKTLCAELAIFRALSENPAARVVYIAPMVALAKERYEDWLPRFRQRLGLAVTRLTGDLNADLKLLAEGQIVVATAEQWDVMSRRWTTRKNVQNVSLVIVDELHLIGGEGGPTLEVVVSRMRYMASQTEKPLRLVGLSTSVANARDLGQWIGAPPSSIFNFNPNVRPVPLEIRVQGFDINNFSAMQLAMSKPCYANIKKHSPSKPVIVFVSSRKHARRVAIDLVTFAAADDAQTQFLHVDEQDLAPHLKRLSNQMLRDTLSAGVGIYHEGMSEKERSIVSSLFNAGAIQVVVAEYSLCWGMTMSAHLVVIMGTQYYEGREHRYVDLPISDVGQMMGRASRPRLDTSAKCTLFCHAPKKEFYKKFLYEPFPVESHLDHALADHINAEIVTKRIESTQDAVDYLTWTYYYRRLTQNPNYYNLQGTSHRHLSDHLSELVENTLNDLEQAQCISIEAQTDLSPLNLGMIASYYCIKYTTVERFSSAVTAKTKLKGLLHYLCAAAEFEAVPVRHKEEHALERLARHLPLAIENAGSYTDPHTKTNVLLQAHFSRLHVSAAVIADQGKVLLDASRLLQALVDVLSSKGWLKPALATMELSQMVSQGCWRTDSPLLQLPEVGAAQAKELELAGVETVYDFIDMEDDARAALLNKWRLTPQQQSAIASCCNAYPNIELSYKVQHADSLASGAPVTVAVSLEREEEAEAEEANAPVVFAPRFPEVRNEGWWLVVGDVARNELVSIKRVAMKSRSVTMKLEFNAPAKGEHNYTLFLMCDSYLGADQEHKFSLRVTEGAAPAAAEASESEADSDADADAKKMRD